MRGAEEVSEQFRCEAPVEAVVQEVRVDEVDSFELPEGETEAYWEFQDVTEAAMSDKLSEAGATIARLEKEVADLKDSVDGQRREFSGSVMEIAD